MNEKKRFFYNGNNGEEGKNLLKPKDFLTSHTVFLVLLYDNGTTDLARNNLKVRVIRESQSC